jgi:hypothetical protein
MQGDPGDVIACQHDDETDRRAATSLVGGVQIPVKSRSTYAERLADSGGSLPVVLHPASKGGLVGVQLGRPPELPARRAGVLQLEGCPLPHQFALVFRNRHHG